MGLGSALARGWFGRAQGRVDRQPRANSREDMDHKRRKPSANSAIHVQNCPMTKYDMDFQRELIQSCYPGRIRLAELKVLGSGRRGRSQAVRKRLPASILGGQSWEWLESGISLFWDWVKGNHHPRENF